MLPAAHAATQPVPPTPEIPPPLPGDVPRPPGPDIQPVPPGPEMPPGPRQPDIAPPNPDIVPTPGPDVFPPPTGDPPTMLHGTDGRGAVPPYATTAARACARAAAGRRPGSGPS